MYKCPGARETGSHGDQRECGDGSTLPPLKSLGSHQLKVEQPKEEAMGQVLPGWVCTEAVKFLLSSAGRGIWTLGEQSIPDPTQNEA